MFVQPAGQLAALCSKNCNFRQYARAAPQILLASRERTIGDFSKKKKKKKKKKKCLILASFVFLMNFFQTGCNG